ncbi:MAG: hypothetical protein ACW99E_22775 [Promethearchaeota archaeon]
MRLFLPPSLTNASISSILEIAISRVGTISFCLTPYALFNPQSTIILPRLPLTSPRLPFADRTLSAPPSRMVWHFRLSPLPKLNKLHKTR